METRGKVICQVFEFGDYLAVEAGGFETRPYIGINIMRMMCVKFRKVLEFI
jgi:hypothetical protein